MKKIGIIIPAAGTGSRMAANENFATTPKQFMVLADKPVLAHAIEAFRCVAKFAQIIVALPDDRLAQWDEMRQQYHVPHHTVCTGGATRFESVRNAIARLDPDCEYIAVHDAARPLTSGELILRALDTARAHGSAIPVVPLTDSVRRLTDDGGSSYPEDRARLRAGQTPQIFRADILRTAYARAVGNGFTDDAAVVESVGYTVTLCPGERRNIKITEPEDLIVAGALV
jgi:2-C-methyl-D-erythritol 4-phosphate cytidylyltransferase